MTPGLPRLARHVGLLGVILLALVVAELPGRTSASTPALPPPDRPAVAGHTFANPAAVLAPPPAPIVMPPWTVSLEGLEAALLEALGALAPPPRAIQPRPALLPPRADGGAPPSYFDGAMVVSFYGHPDATIMGELGFYTPEGAAHAVRKLAAQYEALSPGRAVIPALHLIVDVAQPRPQRDGSYLLRMPVERIQEYVEVARAEGILLFLDLQIGWADPLTTVRRLEPVLVEPFVHLALDPEFATKPKGRPPGEVIGTLDHYSVNQVQHYLAGLVRAHELPRKILVLHQFLDEMLTGTQYYHDVPEVEITVDMDGFGPAAVKATKYGWYALAGYSQRAALKLFYHWDTPIMTPADVLALDTPPDYVIYQ